MDMAIAGPAAQARSAGRDHGFHPLEIARVVTETAEARSFVLDVPEALRDAFAYRAGQFCTFRFRIEDRTHLRSYSMSSSPEVDDEFVVTVKRVAGGVVSNWMIDNLSEGDTVETTCPAGVFCLSRDDGDIHAFAAGSGITPVFSLIKTALATTSRRVHLLYANRDSDSIIFAEDLVQLKERHPGRLEITGHLDVESGFVGSHDVRALVLAGSATESFVCGPEPFMQIVEHTLREEGFDEDQIRIERFTPAELEAEPEAPDAGATSVVVTVELEGTVGSVEHRPGTTILQTARAMGMSPPFSCESGNCATCMARLVEGEVTMRANNALSEAEVEEGWVLTCQSVPTAPSVHVVYEDF